MLRKIDDFILDRVFQRIADWYQLRFDRDCLWIAVQATLISAVAFLMNYVVLNNFGVVPGKDAPAPTAVIWMNLIFGIGILVFAAIGIWGLRSIRNSAQRGLKNPMRAILLPFRLIAILAMPQVVASWIFVFIIIFNYDVPFPLTPFLMTVGGLSWYAAVFFASCSPLPPPEKRTASVNRLASQAT